MRLIDADALIQKRNHAKAYAPDMYVIGQGYVMDAPTISAVPVVRGKWGFRSNGHNITRIGDYEEWHECSVCKLSADYPSSYCPNCGAKMEDES